MSSLLTLTGKKARLREYLDILDKKGEEFYNLTIPISDTVNEYGQNVKAHASQTKEQREAKKDKFYVGNGKVLWTDGKIVKAEKQEAVQSPAKVEDFDDDKLPF